MTSAKGTNIGRYCDAIAHLMRAPSTGRDMNIALGKDAADDRAYGYLAQMKDRGIVYIHEWKKTRSAWAPVYALQPSPFHLPDCPRPMTAREYNQAAKELMLARPIHEECVCQ